MMEISMIGTHVLLDWDCMETNTVICSSIDKHALLTHHTHSRVWPEHRIDRCQLDALVTVRTILIYFFVSDMRTLMES